jgi:hypothetical protein
MKSLVEMLMFDVSQTIERPGSWEGSHMIDVLVAHGYYDIF